MLSCHLGARRTNRHSRGVGVSPRVGEIYRRQQGGAAAVKRRMNLGSISFPERPGLSLLLRTWEESG